MHELQTLHKQQECDSIQCQLLIISLCFTNTHGISTQGNNWNYSIHFKVMCDWPQQLQPIQSTVHYIKLSTLLVSVFSAAFRALVSVLVSWFVKWYPVSTHKTQYSEVLKLKHPVLLVTYDSPLGFIISKAWGLFT